MAKLSAVVAGAESIVVPPSHQIGQSVLHNFRQSLQSLAGAADGC